MNTALRGLHEVWVVVTHDLFGGGFGRPVPFMTLPQESNMTVPYIWMASLLPGLTVASALLCGCIFSNLHTQSALADISLNGYHLHEPKRKKK